MKHLSYADSRNSRPQTTSSVLSVAGRQQGPLLLSPARLADTGGMTTDAQPAPQPNRRWYQFSLRTLLTGTAVIEMAMALADHYWLAPSRRQQVAVRWIEGRGGSVTYAYRRESLWPKMARDWLPPDYTETVFGVSLEGTSVTDEDLIRLQMLTDLRSIDLQRTRITDDGLARLQAMSELSSLNLDDTHVTDTGLGHVQSLARLRILSLCGTHITDAGLIHLRELTRLQLLWLSGTRITDAGLPHLQSMTALQTVNVTFTKVTQDGGANT